MEMAALLYCAILAGMTYTVNAQSTQCAMLATNCAGSLTDMMVNRSMDSYFICEATDMYKECVKGDGSLDCGDLERLFLDQLKSSNINVEELCGFPSSGTLGLSSFLSILILSLHTALASCMISM